jgi:hypothetical protein
MKLRFFIGLLPQAKTKWCSFGLNIEKKYTAIIDYEIVLVTTVKKSDFN